MKIKFMFGALLWLGLAGQLSMNAQEKYFSPSTGTPIAPDSEGFIRRWAVLEPISKINRSNTVFVDSYLREVFGKEYFKGQMTMVPKDGQKVKAKSEQQAAPAPRPAAGASAGNPFQGLGIQNMQQALDGRIGGPAGGQGANRPAGGQGAGQGAQGAQGAARPAGAGAPGAAPGGGMPMMGFRGMGPTEPPKEITETLKWHRLDSKTYNLKLLRFGEHETQRLYGVIYWVVTTIVCDEDMQDVRLAVGSNSASMWWVNGEEALILSGDRRMVVDDCLSYRLNLKKGENIIRGAIINGPGLSDFCVRLYNDAGQVITKGYTIK